MKGREAYPDEELRRRIMDFIMAKSWHAPSTCGNSMFMY